MLYAFLFFLEDLSIISVKPSWTPNSQGKVNEGRVREGGKVNERRVREGGKMHRNNPLFWAETPMVGSCPTGYVTTRMRSTCSWI